MAVCQRFGDGVLRHDGEIDRAKLAGIVFADATARRDLEAIIHPAVYQAVKSWFEALADTPPHFAVADIPLLYETRHEADFDKVIATWCPSEMQVERITRRDGLSEAAARARLAAQMPVDEKASRADYVVRTDGSFADTDRQITEIYQALASR